MKTNKMIVTIMLVLIYLFGSAQEINYNAKTIKLIPDNSFLYNADWETLFYDKTQKDIPGKVGINKEFVVATDESVFILDRMKYSITKLDKSGKIIRTFGKQGWNPGEFANNPDFNGILDGKLIVVSDCQGRINFFDLNGDFVKMTTIDFMPLNIFPVGTDKLIIYGHVPYGDKSKSLIAELDYNTGKYVQIYYTFQAYDDIVEGGLFIPNKQGMIGFHPPFSSRQKMVSVTNDGTIILGTNNSDKVLVFKKENGKYIESAFKINMKSIPITVEDKEEYYQNLKERLRKNGIDTTHAEKVKQAGFFPDYLPYYYNMQVDGESNCLFFLYSTEGKDHQFQAYSTTGQYLGESEFKIEGYDFLSNLSHLKFSDGNVYVFALKWREDVPLRILKCKIVAE
jgi:hypothetical protein